VSGPADSAEAAPGASPDGLPPLREVIREHGLSAQKSLGQNFILDLNLTRRIARAAAPLEGSTVVEVGPGPGGLTRALFLEGVDKVVAVERDERCRPALDAIALRYPGRLDVRFDDALGMNWPELLAGNKGRVVIAANLPYGIATRLLVGWLETEPWPPWWHGMVLMFQKEVAERIVSAPATKAYGRLAILSQWRCTCKIVQTLKAEAFTPPPKVASAVVHFLPRPTPEPACSVLTLGRVTGAAFGQRRKMLRTSLRALGVDIEHLLAAARISPEVRAEQISVDGFASIAAALDRMQGRHGSD